MKTEWNEGYEKGYADALEERKMNQNTFCSKCHCIPSQCCCNTHPAKTLTDEEIIKVAKDFYLSQYVPYDFARAILRKAQEK